MTNVNITADLTLSPHPGLPSIAQHAASDQSTSKPGLPRAVPHHWLRPTTPPTHCQRLDFHTPASESESGNAVRDASNDECRLLPERNSASVYLDATRHEVRPLASDHAPPPPFLSPALLFSAALLVCRCGCGCICARTRRRAVVGGWVWASIH